MILVTGATGLVGSHLVLHLLEQGQAVRALFRKEESKDNLRKVFEYYNKREWLDAVQWVQADILDVPSLSLAFQDVEKVYHCAALISFDPNDEEKLRKGNIEGTANVVNCCIDFGVKKLCYVSSVAALGDLKDFETTLTEETEWNPEIQHSDYGISKYGAEMEVWRGYQEGLSVIVVNPGVILGPLFWEEGSGEIYKKAKNGLLFYTQGTAGFVSVNDVVLVMAKLMDAEISGERFILVSETPTYQHLIQLIAKKLKVVAPRFHAQKWMTSLAWKIDWLFGLFGKKRTLSKNMAQTLHSTKQYDTSKIEKQLGFQFQTIAEYLEKLD